jgi:hypothetical protein
VTSRRDEPSIVDSNDDELIIGQPMQTGILPFQNNHHDD